MNESTFCRMVWKSQRVFRNVARTSAMRANQRWCVARRRRTRQKRSITVRGGLSLGHRFTRRWG
jgi:hypothetical protein